MSLLCTRIQKIVDTTAIVSEKNDFMDVLSATHKGLEEVQVMSHLLQNK